MSDFQNFKAFIPFVNRPDLLEKAVASMMELSPHLSIIDNSQDGLDPAKWPCPVIRPSVPLQVSQTLNFIFRLTREAGCGICVYMHGDGAAQPGVGLELLEMAQQATISGRNWGLIFTLYDILFALNMDLLKRVGEWDVNLPWYEADLDFYWRTKLAGLELMEGGMTDRIQHFSSATIRSDVKLNFLNGIMHPLATQYFLQKWGSKEEDKRFRVAFSRPDLFPPVVGG